MHSKGLLLAAGCFASLAIATPAESAVDAGTPQAAAPAPAGDPQILAVAGAANQGEIEQARYAKKHTKNARVRSFANMMIKDHTAADAQAGALAKKAGLAPQECEASRAIASEGRQTMEKLGCSSRWTAR